MFQCAICHHTESREELVEKMFHVYERYVLVERIPAVVCARCGEATFSRETTERTPTFVHGGAKPSKSVPLEVLDFASSIC